MAIEGKPEAPLNSKEPPAGGALSVLLWACMKPVALLRRLVAALRTLFASLLLRLVLRGVEEQGIFKQATMIV